MSRAIAIAATQENPYKAAINSAENLAKLVGDYMYGTPKRVHYTTVFAMSLLALSLALNVVSKTVLQNCPV